VKSWGCVNQAKPVLLLIQKPVQDKPHKKKSTQEFTDFVNKSHGSSDHQLQTKSPNKKKLFSHIMTLTTALKDETIGLIEVKQHDGAYLTTTVMRRGNKLITGTPTDIAFLRNEWEVDIADHFNLADALEELYTKVCDSAYNKKTKRFR
jgi:hypothetical protein